MTKSRGKKSKSSKSRATKKSIKSKLKKTAKKIAKKKRFVRDGGSPLAQKLNVQELQHQTLNSYSPDQQKVIKQSIERLQARGGEVRTGQMSYLTVTPVDENKPFSQTMIKGEASILQKKGISARYSDMVGGLVIDEMKQPAKEEPLRAQAAPANVAAPPAQAQALGTVMVSSGDIEIIRQYNLLKEHNQLDRDTYKGNEEALSLNGVSARTITAIHNAFTTRERIWLAPTP